MGSFVLDAIKENQVKIVPGTFKVSSDGDNDNSLTGEEFVIEATETEEDKAKEDGSLYQEEQQEEEDGLVYDLNDADDNENDLNDNENDLNENENNKNR